ncbi:MAG: hypothetical protein ILA19_01375 [Bacilli bacterium]|nr:hypothetical protein [Bacilli bacterium]
MTDTSEVYWYAKIFRWLFAMIDKIVYGLISFVNDIFNIIAGTEIRTAGVVNNFFSRIQIILGIIILFKLVISFFSGIVDPDGFSDNKKGVGNIIKRVVVVLVMLLLIIPLNIPENDVTSLEESKTNSQKTWNARMNESGILFGTLSEIQSRIIRGKIIPKLILGNNDVNDEEDDIALILLKSFIMINLRTGTSDPHNEDNWMCTPGEGGNFENSAMQNEEAITTAHILNGEDVDLTQYQIIPKESNVSKKIRTVTHFLIPGTNLVDYFLPTNKISDYEIKETPITEKKDILEAKREHLLNSVNYKCDLNNFGGGADGADGERYIFVYKYFLSTVAGVLCLVLLLSLTLDVAIRVFKLLVLRLISPVAILSYIDSKSEKSFNNWVKAVTSTYLDLFIRIAIISFIMMLIKMIPNLVVWNTYASDNIDYFTQLAARIVLVLGLLFFAKEAPKFITETFGIDNKQGGGLFGGFGKLMGGILGGVSIGAGAIGAFNASRKASKYVDDANGVAPAHWWSKLGNRGKHVAAGLLGAAGGTATGIGAFARSKDHTVGNTRKAMQQRNANILSNARNGGTFLGAVGSTIGQDLLGEDAYSRMEANWKAQEQQIKNEELALKTQQDSLKSRKEMNRYKKDIMDEVTAKTVDSLDTKGSYGKLKDVNYYRFHSAVEAALTNGVGVSTLADGTKVFNWNNQQIKLDELRLYDNEIRKANEADYYYRAITNNGVDNARIREAYRDGRITQNVYGGANGLKAAFGAEERDIGRLSNTLNDQYQRLSDRRQQINDERQSTAAQRAESNSKRFKNNQ